MRAQVKIFRDEGALLIEFTAFQIEQGQPWQWVAGPEGRIIENGFAVSSIKLQAESTWLEKSI